MWAYSPPPQISDSHVHVFVDWYYFAFWVIKSPIFLSLNLISLIFLKLLMSSFVFYASSIYLHHFLDLSYGDLSEWKPLTREDGDSYMNRFNLCTILCVDIVNQLTSVLVCINYCSEIKKKNQQENILNGPCFDLAIVWTAFSIWAFWNRLFIDNF